MVSARSSIARWLMLVNPWVSILYDSIGAHHAAGSRGRRQAALRMGVLMVRANCCRSQPPLPPPVHAACA